MGAILRNSQKPGGIQALSMEARYRLLVDAVTGYAIYLLDAQGLVSSWNAGARRLKGYRDEEVLGRHFSLFHTPEDVEAGLPAEALASARQSGRHATEGWRVRKDGSRFWAHVVIDAIRDPQGRLLGFAKVTRDLTERQAAQEQLRRSEEQFRLLVHSVTDYAIYMIDPQGRVTNWNAGAERIKGYGAAEVVGTSFARFYPPEDQARGMPAKALEAALREGRFEAEGWRLRKDGSRFWASVVIDPIRDAQGRHLGYAKVTRDVTAKREAQQALDRAREELFQVQKLEAIGQLTGGVAHDFNNLLMVILSSLALARRRLPADQHGVLELLHNAAKAARRGAALTQRMLAFARRQALTPEDVDLAELVDGIGELLRQSVGPTVDIAVEMPAGLPRARVDPHQLELAVLNLAVNARDAMPDGGRLTLSAEAGPLPGASAAPAAGVCLRVSDSGQGMDAATLARATEPFFTTKGTGKGTGLGLPMVHGLAAQSGGTLLLRSAPGQGTVAEVWLPAAQGPATGASPRQEADEAAPTEPVPPLAILLVDDDALVLDSAAAVLADLGHTVHKAASGQAALALLATPVAVDLVITDYAMPQMNGVDLLHAMQAQGHRLPAILASGFAEVTTDLGSHVLPLTKPFSQAELQAAVEQAVRLAASAERPASPRG